jgi:hypothetical protein
MTLFVFFSDSQNQIDYSDIVSLVVAGVSLIVSIVALMVSTSIRKHEVDQQILSEATEGLYYARMELVKIKEAVQDSASLDQKILLSEEKTMDGLARAKDTAFMGCRYPLYIEFNSRKESSLNGQICYCSERFKAIMTALSKTGPSCSACSMVADQINVIIQEIDTTIINLTSTVRKSRPHLHLFWKKRLQNELQN